MPNTFDEMACSKWRSQGRCGGLLVLIREIWRTTRLLAVGVAWGGPLIFLSLLSKYGARPGYVGGPLVRLVFPLQQPLVYLAAPAMAVVGVTLVAIVSDRAPGFTWITALGVLLVAAGWLALLARTPFVSPDRTFLVWLLAIAGGGLLTIAALWRRNRLGSVAWATGWLVYVALVWITVEAAVPDGGNDLGVMFSLLFALAGVALAALSASVLASFAMASSARVSNTHRTSVSSGRGKVDSA